MNTTKDQSPSGKRGFDWAALVVTIAWFGSIAIVLIATIGVWK